MVISDEVDYEEVELDPFELYMKLGKGFVKTAKLEEKRNSKGEYTGKYKVVLPGEDYSQRVVGINDGIYSILENHRSDYTVLAGVSAETELEGKFPRKEDFKVVDRNPIEVNHEVDGVVDTIFLAKQKLADDNFSMKANYRIMINDNSPIESLNHDIIMANISPEKYVRIPVIGKKYLSLIFEGIEDGQLALAINDNVYIDIPGRLAEYRKYNVLNDGASAAFLEVVEEVLGQGQVSLADVRAVNRLNNDADQNIEVGDKVIFIEEIIGQQDVNIMEFAGDPDVLDYEDLDFGINTGELVMFNKKNGTFERVEKDILGVGDHGEDSYEDVKLLVQIGEMLVIYNQDVIEENVNGVVNKQFGQYKLAVETITAGSSNKLYPFVMADGNIYSAQLSFTNDLNDQFLLRDKDGVLIKDSDDCYLRYKAISPDLMPLMSVRALAAKEMKEDEYTVICAEKDMPQLPCDLSSNDTIICVYSSEVEFSSQEEIIAAWDALIGWWQTEPNEELHFFLTDYTYPEMDFENVGIFVGDTEYEIVLVLAKQLNLLKDDGSLSYEAAYNMSSLPLVHKATYEAAKVAPTEGVDLWTSKYNSSVETTMSWGPFVLESYQAGKQHVLARNENWYGYALEENEGLYMTDKIVCDIVEDWQAAWVKFQAGEVDGIGIDVSIAADYKGSDRAYFTPSDFVSSLQLQSNVEQLKARETEGVNKSIMGYTDFRKALSLAINRDEFTQQCTTASKAGFGLYNSMHYYDVANGGVFRNTDEAKKVLCNVYNVDYTKYDSLDKAEAAITGYDVEAAKALVTKAYNDALAAGDIKATDKVVLTFGTGSINESVERQYEYLKNSWVEMVKGTPLEGRLEFELKDFATAWANDFRAGAYDICMGGWSGAAWDPGYFLLAYLSPDYMYSAAWDTSSAMMTFTMKGVGANGEDITDTMSLIEWYDCLNGSSGAKYNWSRTALEEDQRLQLIAALEEQVLSVYYTVPLANSFSASMLSYKVDYVTYEYNTFMGYGGLKYMNYNFDDEDWAAKVAEEGGKLNYK
jgi:ABC-type transport system substrate-binding protein